MHAMPNHVFSLMISLDDYVIDKLKRGDPRVMEAFVPAVLSAVTNKMAAVSTQWSLTEFMDNSNVCPEPILLELRS